MWNGKIAAAKCGTSFNYPITPHFANTMLFAVTINRNEIYI